MEELTVILNNKKYLLVEMIVTEKNEANFTANLHKYDCIHQGVKQVNTGGWFSPAFIITKILVPEENMIAFNKTKS